MTKCDVIVEQVCRIPAEFRRVGKKSVIQLIEEIVIAEIRECLTVSAVESQLKARGELVDDWILWSGDKRTSSGWYLTEKGRKFIVGFYPDGKEQRYADRVSACAQFVVHEMGDILSRMTD